MIDVDFRYVERDEPDQILKALDNVEVMKKARVLQWRKLTETGWSEWQDVRKEKE